MTEQTPREACTPLPGKPAVPETLEGQPYRSEEPADHQVDRRELKAIVEALLFVSPEPVSLERLVGVFGTVSKQEIQEAIQSLRQELDRDRRGLQVVELAGGYQMVTRLEHAPWIRRFVKAKATPKLSRSALEALAIIAYKQPIGRAEIEQIRGVEVSGVLRTLLERKLIRIVGRKDVPGRPILYGTTKLFLQQFGLSDLSQLPPLREIRELGEPEQTRVPAEEG
jgi:segregation and condensation protein B